MNLLRSTSFKIIVPIPAVDRRCCVKQMFILLNLEEDTRAGVSFSIKFQAEHLQYCIPNIQDGAFQPLTIFAKSSILDVRLDSK